LLTKGYSSMPAETTQSPAFAVVAGSERRSRVAGIDCLLLLLVVVGGLEVVGCGTSAASRDTGETQNDTSCVAADAATSRNEGKRSPIESQHAPNENSAADASGSVIGNVGVHSWVGDPYGSRYPWMRKERAQLLGVTRQSESAVNRGLLWLSRYQRPNGSWHPASRGQAGREVAATGLALLAFLAAGHTEKTGQHSGVVRLAISHIIGRQSGSGRIGDGAGPAGFQQHVICGLALAEACGMQSVPRTRDAAQKALGYAEIAYAGTPGGPGVGPDVNTLPACAAFLWQARSGRVAGLRVGHSAVDKAVAFLDSCKINPDGMQAARASNRPGGEATPEAAALAMWSACLAPGAVDMPFVTSGARYLLRTPPAWRAGEVDLWHWCHASLALFQSGGDAWIEWNSALQSALVPQQLRHAGKASLEGSWDPVGACQTEGGRIVSTALSVLCLETCYRYGRVNAR
jgi:hypothetical protein